MITPPPDIAAVAGKLSDAGRRVILRPLGVPSHPFYPAAAHRACRLLVAEGLLEETQDNIGNPMLRFLPAGLALRQHLLENGGG